MPEKIFVSYSHQDGKYLDGLKEVLQKHGVIEGDEVSIIDPYSGVFAVGEDIRESIKREIQSASKVVIIYTSNTESSQWVNYEIGMADALDKPMIVVGARGSGKTTLLSSLKHINLIEVDEKG
ncbi:toll/interleukin-1 receptor domain-containing protein [Methyloglobulus sp.]|uniref:toll/interleukin-1 receptor domain-containing protein n=1 Tax=Methyloglobulus sp. TaxID=2518622 RepID=UPI0039895196